MDETHVHGTTGPSKGSTLVGSWNFSEEQSKLITNAPANSPEGSSPLETNPGSAETNELEQYDLPQSSETRDSVEPLTSRRLVGGSPGPECPNFAHRQQCN